MILGRIRPQSKIKKRFTPKLFTSLCRVAENVTNLLRSLIFHNITFSHYFASSKNVTHAIKRVFFKASHGYIFSKVTFIFSKVT